MIYLWFVQFIYNGITGITEVLGGNAISAEYIETQIKMYSFPPTLVAEPVAMLSLDSKKSNKNLWSVTEIS